MNTARILDALAFAAVKHRDQRRKDRSASPYINHPIRVAQLLAGPGQVASEDLIVAAILHDTIEDTLTTDLEIREQFGAAVAQLVLEVTDDKSLEKDERKRLQVERAPQKSIPAKQLKIADKTANVQDLAADPPADWSRERIAGYLDWSERVVAGCRGVNPDLERHFDEALATARNSLSC
jgi:(p)ppGpp synthase/HD superfamily hydrolase